MVNTGYIKLSLCSFGQAAKVKGCKAINEWCEPIRNHFWYVTQNCNGSEEKMKVNKVLSDSTNPLICNGLYILFLCTCLMKCNCTLSMRKLCAAQ